MTEYRKQLYERIKHGMGTIGESDRSAIVMIMDDCERNKKTISDLTSKVSYLEAQLEEYHKYDGFLIAHGFFSSNKYNDPGCIAFTTDGGCTINKGEGYYDYSCR